MLLFEWLLIRYRRLLDFIGQVPLLEVQIIEAPDLEDVEAEDEAQDEEQNRETAEPENPKELSDWVEFGRQQNFCVEVCNIHVRIRVFQL